MKKISCTKIVALLLSVMMLLGVMPVSVYAASIYDDSNGGSEYYNVISEKEWELAPGIKEYEQVLNNDAGTRRQVLHTAVVDVNNPFVKVIPGTKGMWPQAGNYGTQSTSTQALEAEKLGYGNVVVATNCSLSWYTEAYYKQNPHLIGEPLGYSILNGEYYCNSRITNGTLATGGVKTVVVINYDKHPIDGTVRPADMPKVWIRSVTDPLTGWEEQAIPVLFDFLVKPDENGNAVNLSKKEDHGSGIASRTFVGVRADGTLVIAVSDGEQAPYSTGFTTYEMADYMIKMGCIIAANCDGGGSTTFCSQRPGEDLKVNCSLSDGGERPTSNTILVISTAPANGVFARATISTDYDYYTPGSTVNFNAFGTDAVGTKVNIPSDVQWRIKEDGMGTIVNGIFMSSGKEGVVTAQMLYNGQVVGEHSITIAVPDAISFDQPILTIPFGKLAVIPVKATIGGGLIEIGLSASDVTFTTTNAALGNFVGLNFHAVEEAFAPADPVGIVTATLNMGTKPSASVIMKLGKASEVLWDFEQGQADIDEWNVINNRKNAAHWDYELKLSLADRNNGQVHDGNYSMRLETNGLSSKDSHSEQYAWIRLGVDGEALVLENARSVGFWLYVPEDNIQCWVQGHYMTDSNGDGVFDTENIVSMMESENVYYNIDESGWHYLSMDISAFNKIALKAATQYDKDPSDGMTGEKGEFFLALVFHKAINNKLWQENGSINGNYTYYLDNFTVDYSDAADDRENPVFDKVYLNDTTPLVKRDVVITRSNVLNLSVAVADASVRIDADKNEIPLNNISGLNLDTAKAYVDGVLVPSSFANGKIYASGITVADGYHRVKFEICDYAGNKSVIIRVIKVESGVVKSTLKLVPADSTLDRIPFGSIYWMNLEANAIETIQMVSATIDLNNVNHWQLDHMELADGFTATYTINEETNTADIMIMRTGKNTQIGAAVLAKLPVRILYFDTDIRTPGYTAATYWTTYPFWAQDMKMDVDVGYILHVDGTTSTFSNEEFHVDTEMYTSMANMDKAYFSAHGTTHVHTPVGLMAQAPTCTQPGHINRTFCHGCNSVVDWGTTIPVTGHTYQLVDIANRKLVCVCGDTFTGTGLQSVNGRNYYAVNGVLQRGWIGIDDDWYYFDATTFAGADGYQVADQGVSFPFANGLLLSGSWVSYAEGMRYWYGPGYYKDTSADVTSSRPYEIDGKIYLFNRQGYMQTGITTFYDATSGGGALAVADAFIYYDCGTDGVATILNGPVGDYFYQEGRRVKAYRLVAYEGDFYFVDQGNKLLKNIRVYLNINFVNGFTYADGTPLIAGYYDFDADGKMIIDQVEQVPDEEEKLNGPVGDYFYEDGVRLTKYRLVEYEGNFYFIDAGDKLLKNIRVYLSETFVKGHTFADGTPIPAGYYEFGSDGKLLLKNGPNGDYFFKNGIRLNKYQLIEYEGDFYFIDAGDKLLKNIRVYLSETFVKGHTFADGTAIPAGYYEFGADGKMVVRDNSTTLKNGPDGDYFYKDGVRLKKYQLVEYAGSFYFIDEGDKLLKNIRVYLSSVFVNGKTFADGTPLTAGYYEFGVDGKMIVQDNSTSLKNGPDGDYFYKDGVRLKRYQLVEYADSFYFIDEGDKLLKNIRVYLSSIFVNGKTFADGTPLTAGYYEFGADGKMIVRDNSTILKNGPDGDYFYKDGVRLKRYQLVEYAGSFYFIDEGDKLLKNIRVYLSSVFVNGKTFADGTAIVEGYYQFDTEGRMIIG